MKTHPTRQLISHSLIAIATLLVSAVLVLWAWNTFVPEVFGLTAIQYKHSLALVVLGFGLSFVLGNRTRMNWMT
jgi:hypothetical protein